MKSETWIAVVIAIVLSSWFASNLAAHQDVKPSPYYVPQTEAARYEIRTDRGLYVCAYPCFPRIDGGMP